jgi:hypothetical protein
MVAGIRAALVAALLSLGSIALCSAAPFRFASKPEHKTDKPAASQRSTTLLNVHIIPHTHDDLVSSRAFCALQ